MSKALAKLLSKSEAEVTVAISKLEAKNGFPSEDVRLLAENRQKLRTKIAQLGLDPDDTTDSELYHALLARFDKDAAAVERVLGADVHTSLDDHLSKAAQLVNHCVRTDDVWVLKNSVAKKLIIGNPPKAVAKKLHYRSASSLVKREDIAEIYLAAAALESAAWQTNLTKQISKLNTASYELRPIKIVNLAAKWASLASPKSEVVSDIHIGAVAIWPASDLKNAPILCLTLHLLDAIAALNPNGYSESIHKLNPTLSWWAENDYLLAEGQKPISFNLKDAAINYQNGHDFNSAMNQHGAHSLWQELIARYLRLTETFAETIPDIQFNFNQKKTMPKLPTAKELAAEYVTVEE